MSSIIWYPRKRHSNINSENCTAVEIQPISFCHCEKGWWRHITAVLSHGKIAYSQLVLVIFSRFFYSILSYAAAPRICWSISWNKLILFPCYLILGLWPLARNNLPCQLLGEFPLVLTEMHCRCSFWVGCPHLSDKSLGHHLDCSWHRWYSSYMGGRRIPEYCCNCEGWVTKNRTKSFNGEGPLTRPSIVGFFDLDVV